MYSRALGPQFDLLCACPDLFALADAELRVIEMNPVWSRTAGLDAAALAGRSLAEVVVAGDRDRLLAARDRAVTAGTAEALEVRVAGTAALVWTIKAAADRSLIAIYARDLTAARDAEERLAAAERRVQELHRLELVALLAGGIVHHVNNLFCVSMGYLKMLADEIGEVAPARGYLQEVQGATDRAAELVRQLLGLARDPDGASSVDVGAAVKRLELLIRQLVTEQVDFRVDLGATRLPEVHAGRAQLEQILLNLAFAAREAMPDGGELRVIAAESPMPPGPRDPRPRPGVSLSFMHRARARRPGPRVQLVEPLPGWATRFGLSAAQQLVAQCDGVLTTSTGPDGLTTRSVYLPVYEIPETAEMVATRSEPIQGQETILVAEDEEKLRSLIVRSLKRQGYTMLVAESGESALRVAREHPGPLHLLLTDLVMPGISGMELAVQMTSRLPELRVLYISGHGETALSATDPLPGHVGVLEKPFRPAVLAQRVRELLDR